MFENKLIALDFYAPQNFEYLDEKAFRNFVSWLENQKIRLYAIEDRQRLDQIESDEWPAAFEQVLKLKSKLYLKDLALRGLNAQTDREIQVEKMLCHAIRLEYSDNSETYNKTNNSEETSNDQNIISFEKIEQNSEEFLTGLARVQKILQICSKGSDTLSVLQAVADLVSSRLSTLAVQTNIKASELSSKQSNPIQLTLDDIDLGFSTDDGGVNNAAKILRLLHIKELRELQTRINETIVSVQSITANPKTDTKLGKVGV